jgi:hypothetical protein
MMAVCHWHAMHMSDAAAAAAVTAAARYMLLSRLTSFGPRFSKKRLPFLVFGFTRCVCWGARDCPFASTMLPLVAELRNLTTVNFDNDGKELQQLQQI